jgi:hypothetical protein
MIILPALISVLDYDTENVLVFAPTWGLQPKGEENEVVKNHS